MVSTRVSINIYIVPVRIAMVYRISHPRLFVSPSCLKSPIAWKGLENAVIELDLKDAYLCKASTSGVAAAMPPFPSESCFLRASASSWAFLCCIRAWVNWASNSDIRDSNTMLGPSIGAERCRLVCKRQQLLSRDLDILERTHWAAILFLMGKDAL